MISRRSVLPPLVFSHSAPQEVIFSDFHRFRTVAAGRRFGKTFLARNELLRAALSSPRRRVWYVAPTYRQAKELMWRPLKEYIPAAYIKEKNETELSMTLVNGSEIKIKGADNPDSLRGNALDFCVFDECAFMQAYVWDVVRPALADRKGAALFISTPAGYNWFFDLCMDNVGDKNWFYHHYTTAEGGNVEAEELEAATRDMDPRIFRQEFLASFENLAGRVYYAFSIENNVKDLSSSIEMAKNPATQLLVGMDFNINPMTAVVAVKAGEQVHVIQEISIVNGNTEMMANEIRLRYPKNQILACPDPSGHAKHTSSAFGVTDFVLLQRAGFQVLSPAGPYEMSVKINTMNAALLDASGKSRIFFHPSTTKTLQKCFMGLTYVEGTNQPDKNSGLDHLTDACAYMVNWFMPIIDPMRRVKVLGV